MGKTDAYPLDKTNCMIVSMKDHSGYPRRQGDTLRGMVVVNRKDPGIKDKGEWLGAYFPVAMHGKQHKMIMEYFKETEREVTALRNIFEGAESYLSKLRRYQA